MAILKNVPIAKLYLFTRIFSCIRMIRLLTLVNSYFADVFKNRIISEQEHMIDAYRSGFAFNVLLILSNILIQFGVFFKCLILLFTGFSLDVFVAPIFCIVYIYEKLQNPYGIIRIIVQLLFTVVDVVFWLFTLDLYLRLEFGDDIVEEKNINLETYDEYVYIVGPECARINRNQANLTRESSIGSADEKSEKEDKSADVEKNITTKC